MRTLALAALAATTTGCFTSFVVVQASGLQRSLDEGGRDETVPQPGVDERLAVSIPLAIEYDLDASVANQTNPDLVAPQHKTARSFALTCSTKQFATDRVYHSAFRYGSRWKKSTAIAFLVEAGASALFLLLDSKRDLSDPMKANDRTGLLAGGFLAIDAIGTAAIAFIPRKEVFTVDDKAVVTPVRDDCPEGLVLEVAGDTFPVDALGRIGELGEVALDDWMKAPTGTIALTFEGRALPLRIEAREQCAWMRARHADEPEAVQRACGPTSPGPGTYGSPMSDLPRSAVAVMSVPAGALSVAREDPSRSESR